MARKQIDETKARQGGSGRQMLYVLIAAVVLAVVVMTLVNVFGSHVSR